MNCHQETPEAEAEFFLNVYLCKKCEATAKAARDKIKSELHNLLTITDSMVRNAISQAPGALKEMELLLSEEQIRAFPTERAIKLALRLFRIPRCNQGSKENTSQDASTVDGSKSSPSP